MPPQQPVPRAWPLRPEAALPPLFRLPRRGPADRRRLPAAPVPEAGAKDDRAATEVAADARAPDDWGAGAPPATRRHAAAPGSRVPVVRERCASAGAGGALVLSTATAVWASPPVAATRALVDARLADARAWRLRPASNATPMELAGAAAPTGAAEPTPTGVAARRSRGARCRSRVSGPRGPDATEAAASGKHADSTAAPEPAAPHSASPQDSRSLLPAGARWRRSPGSSPP